MKNEEFEVKTKDIHVDSTDDTGVFFSTCILAHADEEGDFSNSNRLNVNAYLQGATKNKTELQYCKDGFFVISSTKNFENLIKSTAAKVTAAVNLSVILTPFIKIELLGFY